MLGILEIIFGLDAITLELRVAGQRLVFLEKLAGIAARAILLPVAGIGDLVWRAGPATAAATAAVLTIIDQM
jgi:hypothetical protein